MGAPMKEIDPEVLLPRMISTLGEPISIGMVQDALALLGLAIVPRDPPDPLASGRNPAGSASAVARYKP